MQLLQISENVARYFQFECLMFTKIQMRNVVERLFYNCLSKANILISSWSSFSNLRSVRKKRTRLNRCMQAQITKLWQKMNTQKDKEISEYNSFLENQKQKMTLNIKLLSVETRKCAKREYCIFSKNLFKFKSFNFIDGQKESLAHIGFVRNIFPRK